MSLAFRFLCHSLFAAVLFSISICISSNKAFCQPSVEEVVKHFSFATVAEEAQKLAQSSYTPPKEITNRTLTNLSYDEYRMIRSKPDSALWHGEALFELQFFHPGFLFQAPVAINEIRSEPGKSFEERSIPFSAELFDIDSSLREKIGSVEVNNFAGFKITYPLHSATVQDDLAVFLGASYFRLVGRNDQFGISARALAIDTAEARGEEFPYFSRFWLIKPSKGDATLTVYALLDGPSVAGAYRFIIHPGQGTKVNCKGQLFFRDPNKKYGLAPLSSMFLRGEGQTRGISDFRSEVHDSDGLVIHMGSSNEHLFRTLANPKSGVRVSSFLDINPKGFGLVQRDRKYENYLDLETRFEDRPDFWIEPKGDWGPGSVELVEIATEFETNDNMVAYWVPRNPITSGFEFEYTLTAGRGFPTPNRAYVVRSFSNPLSPDKGDKTVDNRRFVIDFRGDVLSSLSGNQPVHAEISLTNASLSERTIIKDERTGDWRVTFVASRNRTMTSDVRLNLSLYGESLSEVWLALWNDEA